MSYWKETASKIKETPNQEWMDFLLDSLERSQPEKLKELQKDGDLQAYLKVRVSSAMEDYQTFQDGGMSPNEAYEMAMEQLLLSTDPESQETPEEWETEGAMADVEGQTLQFLTR